MKIRIGISTCPNDTYAFHGLLTQKVVVPGIEFEFELLDIEQLNEGVLRKKFDIAKASFHLALHVSESYKVLRAGSALGFGNGPLLLSSRKNDRPAHTNREKVTLCPGRYTTAAMLFQMFFPSTTKIQHVVFSDIMPMLKTGEVDFGVCIHEGRFTWEQQGLSLVEDLGAHWESEFRLPLPLGGILGSKDLPTEVVLAVQRGIRESLEYANHHRDKALETMGLYAQEFDNSVLMQHVELYVNEWTHDLGDLGVAALNELHTRAVKASLIQKEQPALKVLPLEL